VLNDAVDYCKVAEALGCAAFKVTEPDQVEETLRKAIALRKPVLVECVIPEDDKVFPMVPAGAPISEVFDGDDLAAKGE
jgi:acetolactate synthase-1/2/3 large subunit